jgi:hypothetical protein
MLLAAVAASAARRADGAESTRAKCATELRGLKTLSDPRRKLVNLHPSDITIAEINALPRPRTTPKTRSTAFQRQVWRVTAELVQARLDPENDIRLQLFDAGAYLTAELPAPSCLARTTRDRAVIVRARQRLVAGCGQPTPAGKPLGAVVRVSGVGFWAGVQGPTGPSSFPELQPVTDFQAVAGCGS